jgi:hypothetical protein
MLFYFFFFLSLSLAHHKRLGKKGKTNKTTQIKKAKGNSPQLSRAGVSLKNKKKIKIKSENKKVGIIKEEEFYFFVVSIKTHE